MLLPSLAFALVLQTPAADFTQAWSTIRSGIESRYYARQTQAARMKSLLDKYEPKAKSARSQSEFSAAVNQMITEFSDSHFGLFTKADQGFYMMDSLARQDKGSVMPHVGAWFKPAGDGYTIQMLINGGPAERAGLRKDDVVTKIGGQPFTPIESLQGKRGQKVHLTFRRGAKAMATDVEVVEDNGSDFFLNGTKNSIRIIEEGGKKFGYIHLWTMSNEQQKNALSGAVYGKLKDTDGFILDIRDGFGGRPEGFGDPFFRPEVKLDWEMPGFTQHQLFGYGRPLIVIINKGSRSAKEVFAQIIKESHRGILVGEQTGGNVLGTFPTLVGDWAYIEIPAVDVKTNGFRIEKVGVTPDVKVAREFDDNGKDLFLDEAVRVLARQIETKKAS